jgi:hypothetical protein
VSFELGPKELALLDRHLEPVVEPGTFEVEIAGLKGSFEVRATEPTPPVAHPDMPGMEPQP